MGIHRGDKEVAKQTVDTSSTEYRHNYIFLLPSYMSESNVNHSDLVVCWSHRNGRIHA